MMYNSMQKNALQFDGNSLPNPGDMFNSTGYDMKHRTHQKPQRHLSALHSSSAHHHNQHTNFQLNHHR